MQGGIFHFYLGVLYTVLTLCRYFVIRVCKVVEDLSLFVMWEVHQIQLQDITSVKKKNFLKISGLLFGVVLGIEQ